jgi:hypothetical protein
VATTTDYYIPFLLGLGRGQFNFDTTALTVLLTSSDYTPDLEAHVSLDDITDEVTGTGYTTGGQDLTNVVWTSGGAGMVTLTADNLTWDPVTITARRAVLYQNTGTPSTSRLIAVYDLGEDKVRTAEPLTLNFASGSVIAVLVGAYA